MSKYDNTINMRSSDSLNDLGDLVNQVTEDGVGGDGGALVVDDVLKAIRDLRLLRDGVRTLDSFITGSLDRLTAALKNVADETGQTEFKGSGVNVAFLEKSSYSCAEQDFKSVILSLIDNGKVDWIKRAFNPSRIDNARAEDPIGFQMPDGLRHNTYLHPSIRVSR